MRWSAALLVLCACPPPVSEPPPPVPLSLSCPAKVTFAKLVAGQRGHAALSCDVAGTATGDLTTELVAIDAPFTVLQSALTAPAGGHVTLELAFDPPAAGQHRGTLKLSTAQVALEGEAGDWEPAPAAAQCRAELPAPLLDQVLARAGLDAGELGFTTADLMQSDYVRGGYLDDPFVLSWFKAARASPARIGCFEGSVAGALDGYLQHRHRVAGMIRHAAHWLDRDRAAPPFVPTGANESFDQAVAALCAGPAAPCEAPSGELPDGLKRALAPIVRAITAGLTARQTVNDAAPARAPDFWARSGGNMLLLQLGMPGAPNPLDTADRAFMLGAERAGLYAAAAQLAYAIEDADLAPFAGKTDVSFDLVTAAGVIRVRDGAPTVHRDDGVPVLLVLDLGGDDTWLGPVAANVSGANAVSVAIDLGGADRYGYAPVASPGDALGLPPADSGGRYAGNTMYGPISFSQVSRQGAARDGIAMLFDLGTGNDRYQSLRASQGYAHFGVGVLFDEGGDDVYVAEALAQGAAQFGIGLSIDVGGGKDTRTAFTQAQGFGFVAAFGGLVDDGGDDVYTCNHGDPMQGGVRLYYSPQLPTNGNSSLCQGMGFGARGTVKDNHLSGGLGVLRDLSGNDRYEASVFAQGSGYWQGTGVLSDGAGDDVYDAYYYVQGGAAHYAIGVLADDGAGRDQFNVTRPAQYMNQGAGHDFSLGALLEEGGDDEYRIPGLAAGASNCNGIGLFVDAAGNDRYLASSDYGLGMGNVSTECIDTRPLAKSVGLMIDAAGTDTYQTPDGGWPLPSEGGLWGHARNGLPSEHGGGIDGTGEAGVHSESPAH